MPRLIAKVEGKGNGIKTVIPNMADIARSLGRPPTCKLTNLSVLNQWGGTFEDEMCGTESAKSHSSLDVNHAFV